MSRSTKRKIPPSPERGDKKPLGKTDFRPRKKGKPKEEPWPKLPPTTREYSPGDNFVRSARHFSVNNCGAGYLPVVLGGSHWRGKNSLENIVIL